MNRSVRISPDLGERELERERQDRIEILKEESRRCKLLLWFLVNHLIPTLSGLNKPLILHLLLRIPPPIHSLSYLYLPSRVNVPFEHIQKTFSGDTTIIAEIGVRIIEKEAHVGIVCECNQPKNSKFKSN